MQSDYSGYNLLVVACNSAAEVLEILAFALAQVDGILGNCGATLAVLYTNPLREYHWAHNLAGHIVIVESLELGM